MIKKHDDIIVKVIADSIEKELSSDKVKEFNKKTSVEILTDDYIISKTKQLIKKHKKLMDMLKDA